MLETIEEGKMAKGVSALSYLHNTTFESGIKKSAGKERRNSASLISLGLESGRRTVISVLKASNTIRKCIIDAGNPRRIRGHIGKSLQSHH